MRQKMVASKALATAEATKLWNLYGFESPDDFDLEDVAYAMGILVVDGSLRAADAWLARKGETGIIRVSDSIPESGRRRFAIAHEIGHWILHEKISQLLTCTGEDMLGHYKSSAPELEANYFAAELLMPEHLFASALAGSRPTASLVNRLADYFRTTRTATAMRIADVSSDYFAVVASKDGVIQWWRATEPLREQIWIDVGEAVPRHSAAARFFRGETLPANPEEIDLEDWVSQNRGLHDEYFFEDVIAMPRYGQALSLLWLR